MTSSLAEAPCKVALAMDFWWHGARHIEEQGERMGCVTSSLIAPMYCRLAKLGGSYESGLFADDFEESVANAVEDVEA